MYRVINYLGLFRTDELRRSGDFARTGTVPGKSRWLVPLPLLIKSKLLEPNHLGSNLSLPYLEQVMQYSMLSFPRL